MATKYFIKERLSKLGITGAKIIQELNEANIICDRLQFSRAINGKVNSPHAEMICEKANEIISDKERRLLSNPAN